VKKEAKYVGDEKIKICFNCGNIVYSEEEGLKLCENCNECIFFTFEKGEKKYENSGKYNRIDRENTSCKT